MEDCPSISNPEQPDHSMINSGPAMSRTRPEHHVESKFSSPHLSSARGGPGLLACVRTQRGHRPVYDRNGWKTGTYLALYRLSRYTRTGTGVLWLPRSQTRPESYRIYLICYNIRRRGHQEGYGQSQWKQTRHWQCSKCGHGIQGQCALGVREIWNAAYDCRRRKRAGI